MNRSGFTLIELAVVLLILAILTQLAVRELSQVRDGRLAVLADKQLADLSAAVYDKRPGEEATGFLADTGRLPRALPADPDDASSPLSLRELWERPADLPAFDLRPATSTNLAAGGAASLADPDVIVPCGWRGPYLKLALRHERLLDPWGNRMETPDDAGWGASGDSDARHFRLLDSATNGIVSSDAPIAFVRHFGADGRPDDKLGGDHRAKTEARDGNRPDGAPVPLAPDGGASAKLAVTVQWQSEAAATSVEIRCFHADGGLVRVLSKTGVPGTPILFEGVPPGNCFLRAYCAGAKGPVLRVEVPPRGRSVDLSL